MLSFYHKPYEWFNITETVFLSQEEFDDKIAEQELDRRLIIVYEKDGTQKDWHCLYAWGSGAIEYKVKGS